MILTLEAYKDNLYILQVLNSIHEDIDDSIKDNPYKDINSKWEIKYEPTIKDGFEDQIVFRNDSKKEDIVIIFKTIDELMESDDKYEILSITLYKKNGKLDQSIEINNHISNVVISILNHIDELNESYLPSDAIGYKIEKYLYHVTTENNLNKILKSGFIPHDGVSINGKAFKNRLYFATSQIAAYDLSVGLSAWRDNYDKQIIFKLDSSFLKKYQKDPLFEHGIYIDYIVEPKYILEYFEADSLFNKYDEDDLENLYESIKKDKYDNYIGDGSYHSDYYIIDFSDYPDITYNINKSNTTETVYITYYYKEKSITVRFSNHTSNAVEFGDQLDGNFATKNEVLYHLGLKKRKFIPDIYKYIPSYQVKRSEVENYEMIDLTWEELYDLPVGTDISKYKGKLGKNSNRIIDGDRVENKIKTRHNRFGQNVQIGRYVYETKSY